MTKEYDFSGLKGLSVRASNCLAAADIWTKEEVRTVLQTDPWRVRGIACVGKTTWEEILTWGEISDPLPGQKRKKKVSEESVKAAIRLLEGNGYVVLETHNVKVTGLAPARRIEK